MHFRAVSLTAWVTVNTALHVPQFERNRLTGHKPLQLLSVSRPFTLCTAAPYICVDITVVLPFPMGDSWSAR